MSGLMEVAAESAVQAQAPSGARDLAGSAADSVALRADVPPPLRALRLCQIQEHCLPAVFSNPCSRQRRQHLQDTQYLKLSLLITSRGSRGRNAANSGPNAWVKATGSHGPCTNVPKMIPRPQWQWWPIHETMDKFLAESLRFFAGARGPP